MVKKESNFLKGKDAICGFLSDIHPDTLQMFIELGLPIKQVGGIFWSHRDEIDIWFRGMLLSEKRKKAPAAESRRGRVDW